MGDPQKEHHGSRRTTATGELIVIHSFEDGLAELNLPAAFKVTGKLANPYVSITQDKDSITISGLHDFDAVVLRLGK